MNSVINAVIGIMMLMLAGTAFEHVYRVVQRETIIRVHKGLSPLSDFTKKLTENKASLKKRK